MSFIERGRVINPQYFLLVVGCSRSGTTITSAVLNCHQQIHLAWETSYSLNFWRDLSKKDIYLRDLVRIADRQLKNPQSQGGYVYDTKRVKLSKQKRLLVVGEKIWNPSLLLLAGQYNSIANLENILATPIKIINCIRHPQDVVATMCLRNKIEDSLGIQDRLNWLEQHLLATASLKQKVNPNNFYDCYHEELILNPEQTISELINFLDLKRSPMDLKAVKNILFEQPKITRDKITWERDCHQHLLECLQRYDWLKRYADDIYSDGYS